MAAAVDRSRSVKLRFQRRIAATLASDGDREREVLFSGQVPLPRCRAQSTSTDDAVFLNQAKARAGDRTVLRAEFGGLTRLAIWRTARQHNCHAELEPFDFALILIGRVIRTADFGSRNPQAAFS